MATRSCPECGSQYVASVRRCIDCDVVLVDDVPVGVDEPAESAGAVPVGEGDRVGYELAGWGNQLKVSLEGMLDHAGIRRVWEAGALVVAATDEDEVDALIATLEGHDIDDLTEMDEQVAFEIEDLDEHSSAELDARLIAAGIVHAWSDDGELLVAVDDEEVVTRIVDEVLDAGLVGEDEADGEAAGAGGSEADGLAATEALSDLFVLLDRLAHSIGDNKLIDRLAEVSDRIGTLDVPYGLAAAEWQALQADTAALVATLRGEDETEDEPEDGDEEEADGDDGDDGDDRSPGDRAQLAVEDLRNRVRAWV